MNLINTISKRCAGWRYASAVAVLAIVVGCGGSEKPEPKKEAVKAEPAAPAKTAAPAVTPVESAAAASTPVESAPAETPAATEVAMPAETAASAAPSAPAAAVAGQVSGTMRFEGTAPPRTVIKMSADPKCDAMHANGKVGSEEVLVSKEGQLANVFIYVKKGLEGKEFPAPATSAELDQKGCMYEPHVLGMMVGQKLDIVSSDTTLHNVHCMSKENPEFNFGMPGPGSRDRVFRKAESPIKFKCDVHPWMGAWLHVVPHPFFAVSDRAGAWTIKGLPAGSYTLAAWHEKYGEQEIPITVTDAGLAGVDATFKATEKK